MRYFVANWKANKDFDAVKRWINIFLKIYIPADDMVIISPCYIYLAYLREWLRKYKLKNIFLASQDVSEFEGGSYTGEVSANLLKGLVDFAIIGHSERRKNLNEDKNRIRRKIVLAVKYQIKPILCINKKEELETDKDLNFVAYEPLSAIGTGNNLNLREAINFKKQINLNRKIKFLYGGSVNADNIKEYNNKEINGFLIGKASLDPVSFWQIIKNGRYRD